MQRRVPRPACARRPRRCRRSNIRSTISPRRGASSTRSAPKPIPTIRSATTSCDSARSWAIAAELLEALGTPDGHDAFVAPVRPPRRAAARQRPDHARSRAPLHRHRQRARPRTAGAVRAGRRSRPPRCSCSCSRDLDDFFDERVIEVVLDPGPDRQGRRRRHPHPPALRRRVQRLRPPPAAAARGLRAFADRAQRPRAAAAAEPGAVLAAHHRDPGRAGDVRRADHRQHRHRAHEARSACASRRSRMALDGADFIEVFRYFLDAGQNDVESFASAQRVFRGVPTDRRRRVHQGHRVPARPDRRAHVLPLGAAPAQAAAVPACCSPAR